MYVEACQHANPRAGRGLNEVMLLSKAAYGEKLVLSHVKFTFQTQATDLKQFQCSLLAQRTRILPKLCQ
ncbi:MAG: hypothetical protein EZS28_016085 [Streblomastix strix]|uniref:Uncharacterized protein n=1 Tax=Streblomastix strix TaxID=222440 RepID=A0A5J4W0S7_9EUKA|nr:MAG: hypothetical protein EZS28_016085 [Streblomastix strix]